MALKFITGSKNKFAEIQAILAPLEIEQFTIDLNEIQSLDAHEVIKHKLTEALKLSQDKFIVEDTSLYLECLNNKLPGPFIKWFLEGIEAEGIFDLANSMGNTKASVVTILGYYNGEEIEFFEGRNQGQVVTPTGDKDFGWGPIFKPAGSDKTYGEMERAEKYFVSMRGIAARKLKAYLDAKQ